MPRIRLDFPTPGSGPVVFTDPVRVLCADTPDQVVPALEAAGDAAGAGLHAVGFVGYEAAPAFEPTMQVRGPGELPLLWMGLFREPEPADDAPGAPDPGPCVVDWRLETSRAEHAAAVRTVHAAIAEGRTYQVNLTTRLRGRLRAAPGALYDALRRTQGPGYHALLDLGRHIIVSASPELFFETRGREITTRPMKGTRARGRWPEEDRRTAEELRSSAKDRAENLMIVDLLRNDLGRVCVPGGIDVPALWDVERYRTVWQLTSTVTGRLRDDVTLVDLFRALFPCGSVTGAPKISTMGLIAELEPWPREVYCGAIGWVRPGGDAVFSVPIRTAWVDRRDGRITYGTGGGVVWDSTPDGEYEELVAKTAVVRSPWPEVRLLETLALRDGHAVRLDRHLARMAGSADRFDIPFPKNAIRRRVGQVAAGIGADRTPLRLRITVGCDGDVEIETAPLDFVGGAGPEGDATPPRVVALADAPVDSRDPFLYHKTTHRAVYDRHLAAAPDTFDVVLWNERGEVTELCQGNLVAEIAGRLVTPPVHAGLLPGCLRAELLEEGRLAEVTVALDDLDRATRLWRINSARGWVPVRLPPPR